MREHLQRQRRQDLGTWVTCLAWAADLRVFGVVVFSLMRIVCDETCDGVGLAIKGPFLGW